MKSFTTLFNLVLISFFVLLFSSSSYGDDNTINGSCPGEVIEEMNGITTNTNWTENGRIGGGGNDRYRITFPVSGTLSINLTNRNIFRNANYLFYVSNTTCGNWNLINGAYGNTHSTTVTVNAGDTVWVRMQSINSEPNKGRHDYALALTFTRGLAISLGGRNYTVRRLYNIVGDMQTIGNSVMLAPNGTMGTNNGACAASTVNNSNVNMVFADMDNDTNTFNSTNANITIPTAVTSQDILFVGLYWQGRFINTPIPALANTVKLKLPNENNYTDVFADLSYDGLLNSAPGFGPYNDYQAIADITQRFQNDMNVSRYTNSTIWTADVQADTNRNSFGAWMMVIVYKDPNANLKNITIYDGFMSSSDTQNIVQVLSGFKTPKSGEVNANFYIFGGEGDILWDNDTVSLTTKNGNTKVFASNVFNSTIEKNGTNVTNRNPSCSNTIGIDIDSYPVGITNGTNTNSKIIGFDQNTTTVTISTPDPNTSRKTWDQVFPGMFAFSADLRLPEICYDYVIQKNAYTLNTEERNITSFGTGELSIGIALQSMEGDFDLENTSVALNLNTTNGLTFDQAFYSPNTVNILIPAILVDNGSTDPSIAIGENATSQGGTIRRLQRYFTRFDYTQTDNTYQGHFEVDVNASINFGSGPVVYRFSTDDNTITQCPISNGYSPDWLQFNIERTNSWDNLSAPPEVRYPLYTQIVGRDFDVSIVSYDAEDKVTPHNVSNLTVDVELIDAKPFGNQKFKCENTFESILQKLPNGDNSFFVKFPEDGSARVDLTTANDSKYSTDLNMSRALESAAFRLWVLVDSNNTIIRHTCDKPTHTNQNDQCFIDQVYPDINDSQNRCPASDCSNYTSPRGETGCYACYRDFFAKPICSRDNFSIRPETYTVTISDDNQSVGSESYVRANNNAEIPTPLSAGYKYKLDINATSYQSNAIAKQYNTEVNATVEFDDNTACHDQNGSTNAYVFTNGKVINKDYNDTGAEFSFHEVGDHLLHIIDQQWTKVDQRGFLDSNGDDLKTFPQVDDCIRNDSSVSINGDTLSGCDINSNYDASHTNIALTFEPYSFDIQQVNFALHPNNDVNFSLMNDFSNDYYNNSSLNNEINMTARMAGRIIAKSKNGVTLKNFTASCHAIDKNITLSLRRTTSPIGEENLTSIQYTVDGRKTFSDVSFQQQLTMQTALKQIGTGVDKNLTLAGTEFLDSNLGEATIVLDTTMKKPPMDKHHLVNPIDVNYSALVAHDEQSYSYADLSTMHVPEGNKTINRDITYYFAALRPRKRVYGPTDKSWENTPVYVDIFCDANASVRITHGLTTVGREEGKANWWAATMYQPDPIDPNSPNTASATALQDFDLAVHRKTGADASPSVKSASSTPRNSNTNIVFDDPNAAQNDINVSLATTARPSTVEVVASPAPFLRYSEDTDPSGLIRWDVKFIGPSAWSGVGGTGKTIETTANPQTTQRMGW